ncbi:MAG: CBS domain-containing protein [Saprospiraceae bacterium]|nr:CBS domain-containing protein [Saprospiraceae bacterium]
MGEQKVSIVSDQKQMQKFVKSLLADVQALEHMLDNGWFENDITRIGAEQEMVMVDKATMKPACIAVEALEKMTDYPWVETELAKFNLETNLTPRELKGSCFSDLQEENGSKLDKIQEKLEGMNAHLILTGILPTLTKNHMEMSNLTPMKRYKALMEAIKSHLNAEDFNLRLTGIDELSIKHSSPLLEAVNTSFQVHLQVGSDNFVKMYNIAQALTGPIIAISSNSPLVFGKRLWHESRIAMFQQSIDTRTSHDHMREKSARVSFGNDWLHESVLEIYKEDISRFRVLLSSDVTEDSLALIRKGEVPKLRSLQVHNSTVYRWNRPCYGVSDNGKPHLRIENRVLPSGPTNLDEVANAAFWIGAMEGIAQEVGDIREYMQFADAQDNFVKASKFGIDSEFNWLNDEKISAKELIIDHLIPYARIGLQKHKVDQSDIDKYLQIIEGRARNHMTGARWILRAYTDFQKKTSRDEALTAITAVIIENQKSGVPVHEWKVPKLEDLKIYKPSTLSVAEFMTTDLFTVQKDDIIDLVAEMMDWRKIKYTPVEDQKGNLIGLVTARLILRHMIKNKRSRKTSLVSDIMLPDPITITQDTNILDAMAIMRDNKVGCLPVVKGKELIGLVTEMDCLRISGRFMERMG